ncbi:MAG: Holliday junction branch migration protein RuvA [Elusimicrobia bacterium]|nr:Holliday junction branch migration protein RuvA [Elusimicrobiota bacterium]
MFVYLKGILKSKEHGRVIIENSGIGYELYVGEMTYANLPEPPEEVMLYTYHYVREDREELYGFSSQGEKGLFTMLIGVSSIGPGKAVSILSQISPDEFINAVRSENISLIASIKGLGRKTAERVVMDLKDRLADMILPRDVSGAERRRVDEAMGALVSLGFRENIAREMISSAMKQIKKTDSTQDIIKKALKNAK